MTGQLTFLETIRHAKRSHVVDSVVWFLFTIVGGLLPVWGGAVLLWIAPGNVHWLDFASHGEFALYSAALLAPAIYIVTAGPGGVPFPSRTFVVLIEIILLLLAVLAFSGITFLQRFHVIGAVEGAEVAIWSIRLFTASAVLSFLVNLVDILIRYPDPRQLAAEGQKALEQDFDKLK